MFGRLFGKKQDPARQRHIQTMQQIKAALLRLKRVYEQTSRRPAQASLRQICMAAERVLDVLAKEPAHTARLALFAEYYLPETASIAEQYALRVKSGASSQDAEEFTAATEDFFRQAADAFDAILQGLLADGGQRAEVDMEVLLAALKERGPQ